MARAAAVLVLALALALGSVPGSEAILNNTITQWVNATREIARVQGLPNTLAIQEYNHVTLAIYRGLKAGGAPEDALAAYAAHATTSSRFPVLQPKFDKLLAAQTAKFSDDEKEKARAIAAPIAHALLIERVGDPATKWLPYKPRPAGTPGAFQYGVNQTFSLSPQLADSNPWVWPKDKLRAFTTNKDPTKGKVFEPPTDPKELESVIDLGAKVSKGRSKYDTDTASFWSLGAGDGPGSSSVSGLWLEIASRVLPEDLSLKETAEVLAKITTAFADAYIACWQVKYRTDYWRPTTAIHQGWEGFKGDKEWKSLLTDPPFPEYPSGHQCSSGAGLKILQRYLGTDNVTFTVISDGAPAIGPRTYNSLLKAANEAADSRLFSGVHFNQSNYDGQALGILVADYVYDNFDKSVAANGKAQPLCTGKLVGGGAAAPNAAAAAGVGAKPAAVAALKTAVSKIVGGAAPNAAASGGRRLLAN